MGTPERYLGTALQLVDDKNRVSIPAKFREAVIANTDPAKFKNGPYVLIGKHPQFPCLIAYDIDWLESEIAFAAEGRRGSEQGAAYYREIQTLAGGAEPVGFDTTGRCTLQPAHKAKAGITKNAFFYGSIFNFEIWDPQTLLDCADASPTAKDYCRSLMQEKGLS